MSKPFWSRVLFGTGLLGASLLGGMPTVAETLPTAGANALVGEAVEQTDTAEQSIEATVPFVIADAELKTGVAQLQADTPSLGAPNPSPSANIFRNDPSLHDTQTQAIPQVTSVSQLRDVFPTDWAFQAVQSLVERYGCIAGYPNGTFRGNNKATRYEMAAALNACLDQISDRFASKADIDMVKALQAEFAAELATLRGRVDGLEARVATVEAQQFSTTTKLKGEVIFGFSGLTGDVADGTGDDIESRLSLTQRTRLTFITSFSGKDRLFTRLQSQNRPINFAGVASTNATRLAFDTGNSDSAFTLDRLDYRFPIGDDINVTIFTNAAFHHYYATTTNPYFEGFGGGKGAISWFGERNPIFRNGTVGVSSRGVGAAWTPGDFRFDLGYFANLASSPVAVSAPLTPGGPIGGPPNGSFDGGLFGGGYSALAQASYKFKKSQVALTYVRTFDPTGSVRSFAGTLNANLPFTAANSLITDSVGFEGSFGITDNFAVGGWFGYTFATQASGASNDAQILNAALNFAVKDVGKEGAVAGLIVGIPPYVINNDIGALEDPDAPIHLEANYQFPVSKNILITPGVFYLINPDGDSSDDGIFVGAIRTTFKF